MSRNLNLRNEMPWTAAILDELRAAFGKDAIDGQIRKALNGEPTFWARENGHRLGARNTVHTSAIRYDALGVSYSAPAEWILEARAFARQRGINIEPADQKDPNDVEREANALRSLIQQAKARLKQEEVK